MAVRDGFVILGGIPAFITDQVEPGTMLAMSLIYAPTKEFPNRYRISAVKVIGVGESTSLAFRPQADYHST